MDIEELARDVVDSGYKIHTELGPGLLESVYEVVLAKVLSGRGYGIERQNPVPIVYEGIKFDEGPRADLLVEQRLLVEVKSVASFSMIHIKQVS